MVDSSKVNHDYWLKKTGFCPIHVIFFAGSRALIQAHSLRGTSIRLMNTTTGKSQSTGANYLPRGTAGQRGTVRRLGGFVLRGGFYFGCLALLALIFGFVSFQASIDSLRSQPRVAGDGIVVLTGGQHRVATGFTLLEKGMGARLLVSGVHSDTSKKALLRAAGREGENPCCLDIGHEATNTVENALEVSEWAASKGYGKLVVVTSDYHMPRALAEISHRAPGLELLPYVAEDDAPVTRQVRHADAGSPSRLVLSEYAKFIAAKLRMWVEDRKPLTNVAALR